MHKLMNKDKIVLRFTARMLPSPGAPLGHADEDRRFTLSYFTMDDTIAVFEPPMRNRFVLYDGHAAQMTLGDMCIAKLTCISSPQKDSFQSKFAVRK